MKLWFINLFFGILCNFSAFPEARSCRKSHHRKSRFSPDTSAPHQQMSQFSGPGKDFRWWKMESIPLLIRGPNWWWNRFRILSPGPSPSSSDTVHGLAAFLRRLEVRNSCEAIKQQVHVWHVQLDDIKNPWEQRRWLVAELVVGVTRLNLSNHVQPSYYVDQVPHGEWWGLRGSIQR